MLTFLIGFAGAVAVLVSSMIHGYQAQSWMRRRAPALYAYLPRDPGVIIGILLAGIAIWRLLATS